MTATNVYTDICMNGNQITYCNEFTFNSNQNNVLYDTSPDIFIQGNQGMELRLNDPDGGIRVANCSTFRPDTDEEINLGSLGLAWKNLYLADGAKIYINGVEFGIGDHTHASTGVQGGNNLTPLKVVISTLSAARLRLPVGTNMYGLIK